MDGEKWYVCIYDMWHRHELDPMKFENAKEAKEYARSDLKDDLERYAESFAQDAEVTCREATPEEIVSQKKIERNIDKAIEASLELYRKEGF